MSKFYQFNIIGNNPEEIEEARIIALMGINEALDIYPSLTEKQLKECKEYLPQKAWIWKLYEENPLTIIEYALNHTYFPEWLPLLPDIQGESLDISLASSLRENSLWEFNDTHANSTHEKLVKIIDYLPKKSKTWLKEGFSINYGTQLVKKSIEMYKKTKSLSQINN